jgi:hypothetical protein
MEWDDRGNLINFRAFDQDQKYQNGLRFIYDENDKLVAVEELDAQAKVIKRSELAYKHDENLVVVRDYDANGKFSGSQRFIYDLQGKPIFVEGYDAQRRLHYENSFENQYDEFGNCTFRKVVIELYNGYIYYPETPEPSGIDKVWNLGYLNCPSRAGFKRGDGIGILSEMASLTGL